jgi:N-acetylmuramic acid 6-phosphate (MurNAc-6-P) etherase
MGNKRAKRITTTTAIVVTRSNSSDGLVTDCLRTINKSCLLQELIFAIPPTVRNIYVLVEESDEQIHRFVAEKFCDPSRQIHVWKYSESRIHAPQYSTESAVILFANILYAPEELMQFIQGESASASRRDPAKNRARNQTDIHRVAYRVDISKVNWLMLSNSTQSPSEYLSQSPDSVLVSESEYTRCFFSAANLVTHESKPAIPELVPLTESADIHTESIDIASSKEALAMYAASECTMFSESVWTEAISFQFEKAARAISAVLNSPNGRVVLSGVGTSGRLSVLTATLVAKLYPQHQKSIKSCIAGGMRSFLKGESSVEDDPDLGVSDLLAASVGADPIALIGTTCGLSSAYVLGQIRYLINKPRMSPILLGFNPIDLAPVRRIGSASWNFRGSIRHLNSCINGILLNPIIGPEPIAASSRLKGGTFSIILQFGLLKAAIEGKLNMKHFIRSCETLIESVYRQEKFVLRIIDAISALWKRKDNDGIEGRCYYVGAEHCGILGYIDSAGSFSTFDSTREDLCGFVKNPWKALIPTMALESTYLPAHSDFRLDYEYFEQKVLKQRVLENDIAILIHTRTSNLDNIRMHILSQKVTVFDVVLIRQGKLNLESSSGVIDLSEAIAKANGLPHDLSEMLLIKTLCNCISTIAGVKRGRTYKNRMVDFGIANEKLFNRAVGVIVEINGISEDAAKLALLKTIHGKEVLGDAEVKRPMDEQIRIAHSKKKVVPVACLISVPGSSVSIEEARLMLRKHGNLRLALEGGRFTTKATS